jgi:hypothetical protein
VAGGEGGGSNNVVPTSYLRHTNVVPTSPHRRITVASPSYHAQMRMEGGELGAKAAIWGISAQEWGIFAVGD